MARKAVGSAFVKSFVIGKNLYGRSPSIHSFDTFDNSIFYESSGRSSDFIRQFTNCVTSYRENSVSLEAANLYHQCARGSLNNEQVSIESQAISSVWPHPTSGLWSISGKRRSYHRRSISVSPHANGKRKFMIDTLALVRKLEAQGLSAQQAEGITALIMQIMNESMEDISLNFVSKQDIQMADMKAETELSKFKSELKSLQEQNYDSLRREAERLKTELEKIRSELRYEVDKVTAGQRLDMNLEKGRIREELQNQNQETSTLSNKLDREINVLKTELEAAKFDVIKYCVGTLVSISAVGLGLLRILM